MKYQLYRYTRPEGCCCDGCCRLAGLEKPEARLNVACYDYGKTVYYTYDDIDTEQNREYITKTYGLTIDNPVRNTTGYFSEIKRSMTWLGQQDNTLFLGQAVKVPGTAMRNTLTDVNNDKLLELPVFEQTQLGMSIGLALQGFVPVSIFPRQNFLLSAMDQLVNHVDKYPLMGYSLGMIIRTAKGSISPLDPHHQHKYSYTECFKKALKTINMVELNENYNIFPAYEQAYKDAIDGKSTLLVEYADNYNQ